MTEITIKQELKAANGALLLTNQLMKEGLPAAAQFHRNSTIADLQEKLGMTPRPKLGGTESFKKAAKELNQGRLAKPPEAPQN